MKRERGAVVVEAVISMTTFIFTILIILSIVEIALVQSKMAVALDSAAKEISQYSFLYYKFQLAQANAALSEGTEDAETAVRETKEGIETMMSSFGGVSDSLESADFDSAIDNLNAGADAANETVSNLANQIADDPKGFLAGMGKLAGREVAEGAKVYLAQAMAKAFMSRNLKFSSTDGADAADHFLKKMHVKDGLEGLSFSYSALMPYGASSDIQLVCSYEVEVIKLLNHDFSFKFRQMAQTMAWGAGTSLITPRSIWTSMNQLMRGKHIVGEEKKGFVYTSTGHGYHAFDNSGGKNEFVTILSMNPYADNYATVDGIKNYLWGEKYTPMESSVSALGDPITVTQGHGEGATSTTVASDPATRTYRLLVVIPEEADAGFVSRLNDAITAIQAEHPEANLVIDYKEGYGEIPAPVIATPAPAGDA